VRDYVHRFKIAIQDGFWLCVQFLHFCSLHFYDFTGHVASSQIYAQLSVSRPGGSSKPGSEPETSAAQYLSHKTSPWKVADCPEWVRPTRGKSIRIEKLWVFVSDMELSSRDFNAQ
jgi:hypothetical protein